MSGYRQRIAATSAAGSGVSGNALASIAAEQSPEHSYTVLPSVEPGVYGFESGTNTFGRFQAGWYTSPTDRVGVLGENHFRLATVAVTSNHDLAVEAWQQYADRIAAATPQQSMPASTFSGGFGQTMGAAWNGFAGGVANLAADLGRPRWAEGGVKASTAFFRDVDRMGVWRASLLRGVEGTLAPWQLGGSIVGSSTGTVGSLWRGDMAGAGQNLAALPLESIAVDAMIVGGRAGVGARTSFALREGISVADGFVAARVGNTVPRQLELFTGERGAQVPGAAGVGPMDPAAIAADARNMPNIPSGSQSRVVASNPFIPQSAGGTGQMMDYLPEAARVTEPGGHIVINGNSANKYFTTIPSSDQLGQLGLKIGYQGELLPEFRGMSFVRTDGSPIDPTTLRSIVFNKKP